MEGKEEEEKGKEKGLGMGGVVEDIHADSGG